MCSHALPCSSFFFKPTKIKKDKEAPWEKIDFLKHKQDDNAQSDQVSANEELTSDLDLPAQPVSIEEDFGFSPDYMDVEVPLKVILLGARRHRNTDHRQYSAGMTKAQGQMQTRARTPTRQQ